MYGYEKNFVGLGPLVGFSFDETFSVRVTESGQWRRR
tara:strand:- start:551 stop:661 length:111 start_codon:yes stop_codon:yes gene_type:complete